MLDQPDYDIETTPAPDYGAPPRRSLAPWLLAAAVVFVVGVAIWFYLWNRPAPEAPAEQPATVTAAPPAPTPRTLCETTDTVALPSLNDSDDLVGTLVGAVSKHPRVTAWVATDNLVRNFAVVVENIANGASPATHLRRLRPAGAFRVTEKGGELFVDPRSYERYTPIADAVDSVDAQAAARLCGTLKPRLEEAYGELGREGSFDSALERAIVAMLRTPALDGGMRLVPRGAAYGFEDGTLESLTPAQKHLARMGPRNVRLVQGKLRDIALAIGIPQDRLPQ